jgi:hypothetical protein
MLPRFILTTPMLIRNGLSARNVAVELGLLKFLE